MFCSLGNISTLATLTQFIDYANAPVGKRH